MDLGSLTKKRTRIYLPYNDTTNTVVLASVFYKKIVYYEVFLDFYAVYYYYIVKSI